MLDILEQRQHKCKSWPPRFRPDHNRHRIAYIVINFQRSSKIKSLKWQPIAVTAAQTYPIFSTKISIRKMIRYKGNGRHSDIGMKNNIVTFKLTGVYFSASLYDDEICGRKEIWRQLILKREQMYFIKGKYCFHSTRNDIWNIK